jgi:hypothetical protein
VQRAAHVVLLLLVPAQNAYFFDIGLEHPAQDGVAERASPARDQQRLTCKHGDVSFS